MDSITATAFLDQEYSKAAAYDTLRSLANCIDGLKISERKAIWVALNNELKHPKVAQFASKVSEQTSYIHGEGSMQLVITNLGRNFVGSNNTNLLLPDGNFGSRWIKEPSAPRYIFVGKEKVLDYLFPKEDLEIYEAQIFEGDKIEPKYLVPTIPFLLINGVEGIGTGYKQNILPRNPKHILKVLKDFIAGNTEKYKNKRLIPWYRGFKGKIRMSEDKKAWEILGHAYYKNTTTIIIDEIPVGYTLGSYTKVLEALRDSDSGKNAAIKNFTDLSEDDTFKFEVKVSREFGELEEDELLGVFKLIKRETEIFTAINTENRVIDEADGFTNEFDIIREFLKVKLAFMQKRKTNMLDKLKRELKIAKNKYLFIKAVNDGSVNIRSSTKDVKATLEAMAFDKIDDSYSYLLDMKIHSLTEDKIAEYKKQIMKMKENYTVLKTKTPEKLLLEDLAYFDEFYK